MNERRLIETSATLEEFFHQRVDEQLERHGLDGPGETRWYLVQLLCTGARGRRLFEACDTGSRPPPLAELYRRASEAPTEAARRAELQRLGDLAMLVASLFADSLRRKPVKVDYVIAMGGAAYGSLAGSSGGRASGRADVFNDLAEHFSDYVCALSRIADSPDDANVSLAAQLDRWDNSRHPELARALRARGVFVDIDDRHH